MLTTLVIVILFAIFIIAAAVDIKTLEVPDWLNYSGITIGLCLNSFYSLSSANWQPIMGSATGAILGLAIGALMYYTGQWGGGDAKLLIAVGALIGVKFAMDSFALSFLFNLLILGALWGLIYTFVLGMKNIAKTRKIMKTLKSKKGTATLRLILLAIASAMIIASFFIGKLPILFLLLAVSTYMMFYLILFVKSVELSSMHKWVNPDKLVEGDWLVHKISIDGENVAAPRKTGLTKTQVNRIKELYGQKKIKKIYVKYGVPFTPAFLLAFSATLLWGNILISIAINL